MSWTIRSVTSSATADFEEAYAALHDAFAPRGELERRSVLARWLDDPRTLATARGGAELEHGYHLLTARSETGDLAGVRDFHLVVDRAAGIAVVYLAHVLVSPFHRRSGLGALLRERPIELGRSAGVRDVLVAAEMEHPVEADEASVVRLVAYGAAGFSVVAPAALPYLQPDFGELEPGAVPRPIPLLAVVRWLGHEGAGTLPVPLARAYVTHLYAVFATHVLRAHLDRLEARTLDVLAAAATGDQVPLLPLPRTLDDRAALTPLEESR